MTPNPIHDYIERALSSYKGDDLEQANRAFGELSEKELDMPHGQTGKTRREIWTEYKKHRALHVLAIDWFRRHAAQP